MAVLCFPICDDDEMLAAAEPLDVFLKAHRLAFRFTGHSKSTEANVSVASRQPSLEFAAP
jgi:hypothetical protein